MQAYRVHPLAGPAVASAAHLPSGMLLVQWYALVEHRAGGPGATPERLRVRRATGDDLEAFLQVGAITAYEVRHRLARGDIPYLAFEGDAPVAYKWFRVGSWREVNLEFHLGDDAWSYDLYVAPAARGRGVASALTTRSIADLAPQGVRRALAAIYHLNRPSLATARRAGSRIVRSYAVIGIGPVEIVIERDGETRARRWRAHRRDRLLRCDVPTAAGARPASRER